MNVGYGWFAAAWLCAACARAAVPVDGSAIGAEQPPGDWLSYGRNYNEQRFSPLAQIDTGNVNQLGLYWWLGLDGIKSLEATPLAREGTLYFTGNDSIVFAV